MTTSNDLPIPDDEDQSDRPIEEQGLPTRPLDEIPDAGTGATGTAGESFGGDDPEAGRTGENVGTKSDDLDADDADSARAADQAGREKGIADRELANPPQQSYGTDPTADDAPPADMEQPVQNPDSPLGRGEG